MVASKHHASSAVRFEVSNHGSQEIRMFGHFSRQIGYTGVKPKRSGKSPREPLNINRP